MNRAPENEHEVEEPDFKPLTAQEAQEWRKRHPPISVMRVVWWQVAVGLALALLAGLVWQQQAIALSAGYGALAVVIPSAMFARGLRMRLAPGHASAAMVRFFGLEIAKLALTVVLLAVAPKLVRDLNWLALVIGLVVVMKTYWLALWMSTRSK
ncbi:hypothetical protein GCM10027082_44320 [Comamonas humi]